MLVDSVFCTMKITSSTSSTAARMTAAQAPLVREWRQYRSIPYRTKVFAIVMMAATLTVSIVFFVPKGWMQGALAAFGVLLAAWLYRVPSRDRP